MKTEEEKKTKRKTKNQKKTMVVGVPDTFDRNKLVENI